MKGFQSYLLIYQKVYVTGYWFETYGENLEPIVADENIDIDWDRCQKCRKPCKILLNHVKKLEMGERKGN